MTGVQTCALRSQGLLYLVSLLMPASSLPLRPGTFRFPFNLQWIAPLPNKAFDRTTAISFHLQASLKAFGTSQGSVILVPAASVADLSLVTFSAHGHSPSELLRTL